MIKNQLSKVAPSVADREMIIFSKTGTRIAPIKTQAVKVSDLLQDPHQSINQHRTSNTNSRWPLNSNITRAWLARITMAVALTTINNHRCTCSSNNNNSSSTISKDRCLPTHPLHSMEEAMHSQDPHQSLLQISSNKHSHKTRKTLTELIK